jgi:BON domain
MKRINNKITRTPVLSGLAVLISFVLFPVAGLVAQGTGGTGGGNTGGNTQGQTGNQQVTTGQQTTSGGTAGQTSQFSPSDAVDFGSILDQFVVPEIEQIESERLQPFVGASRSYFEEKQIPAHPRSQLAPGSGGGTGGGNSFGGFSTGGRNAFGQTGQFGSQNGFIVSRLGVRARLYPQIVQTRPRINEQTAAMNFQERLLRIPATQDIASAISLNVSGGRAVLSGTVANDADKVRIERMARLEPGVYAIENRITVSGQ